MIFYRKNLITNTALSNVKRYFLLLVFIFSVIQIFISNFNYIDLLIILMILSSTFFMMLTIFNIKYITEYFIPFIIVFSLNIFSISGALIFKTIFLQNLSSNLFLPLKTFATLSSLQTIWNQGEAAKAMPKQLICNGKPLKLLWIAMNYYECPLLGSYGAIKTKKTKR